MASDRKKVVVLGAGFAGASVARALDNTKGIDVTLVAPNENFMVHKPAALRAAVKGGSWQEASLIPTDRIVKNGEFIRGAAKSVNAQANTVTLEDGKELKYDALVIATGSRNVSPGDLPASARTKEDAIKYFAATKEAVQNAKSIVIVGGGAVAIELAGEIREFGQPKTKITLVTRASQLMTDGSTYRPAGLKALDSDLKKHDVDVVLNDEVTSHALTPDQMKEASPIVKTSEGVTLKSGKKIEADLLIYAIGSTLNTEFLPEEWLDKETKEVLVDPKTLQLTASPNVFAIGDVAKTGFAKRAYFAVADGAVLAKNISQFLAGKKPANKVQRMNMALVSFGAKGGRGLMPFGTLGPWLTSKIKSKSLFVGTFWSSIAPGSKPPATA